MSGNMLPYVTPFFVIGSGQMPQRSPSGYTVVLTMTLEGLVRHLAE